MKKLIALFLCVTLSLSVLTGCGSTASEKTASEETTNGAAGESTKEDNKAVKTDEADPLEGKHFVVGINPSYPSFESVDIQMDGTKEYEGLDIDLLNALAEKCGFTYELSNMNHSAFITALQEGEIDFAISAIRATEEEEKYVDFSDSYMSLSEKYGIVFRTEDSFSTADDLSGKTISCVNGEDYELVIPKIKESVLTTYGNSPETVEKLLAGETDAFMTDEESCAAICSENSGLSYIVLDSTDLGEEACEYAMAFPKDSEYLASINTALGELKEDGTVNGLIDQWFGDEDTK